MREIKRIGESEYRLCLILWEHEPIPSGELVKLCEEQLNWKPTTTYTVIKRLSNRGILKNEHSVVTSLVSKAEVQDAEMEEFIKNRFEDSVPSFLASFTRRQKLSQKDIDELQALIDSYRRGEEDE